MIYVDALRFTQRSSRWRYDAACHLMADSLDELHEFARLIGLRRPWFQDGTLPHYDLTARRRVIALQHGAIELTRKEVVARIRAARAERTSDDRHQKGRTQDARHHVH